MERRIVHVCVAADRRKRVRRALSLALLSGLLLSTVSGCAFFTPDLQLRVVLPDERCPWEEFLSVDWRIVYPDRKGKLKTADISAADRSTRIRTARGLYVPVAAYPLGRLRPAGGFVAHTVKGKERLTGTRRLELSWEAGATDLYLELWEEREKIGRADPFHLTAQMSVEGGGDPWACDLERIRSALLFDSLSTVQISGAERFEAEFELPAADWICASPLFSGNVSPVAAGAEGGAGTETGAEPEDGAEAGTEEENPGAGSSCSVRFTGLYRGLHRFYSPSADRELHILVEKNGECRFICVTPR